MLDSYPFQLSGGMAQRVLIVMALMNNPKLVLADEPSTALDVTLQKQALELMDKLTTANKELINLHKQIKDIQNDDDKIPHSVTNALFVGSTADLQKLLKNNI